MKGQSLIQIYEAVNSIRFRCRDITTLRDYVSLAISRWTIDGQPLWFTIVCCEDGLETTRGGEERRYGLLSSQEELNWLQRLKQERAVMRILQSYEFARTGF